MNKNVSLTLLFGAFFIFFITAESVFAEKVYRVKSSDNLNKIVKKHYAGSDLSRSQILAGILERNPKAFENGNINSLKRGQRLVLPEESTIQIISKDYAENVLAQPPKSQPFRSQRRVSQKKTRTQPKSTKVNNSRNLKSLKNKQNQQTKQIKQLKQEGAELKNRLEQLVAEKKERDDKLTALEDSLKNSIRSLKNNQKGSDLASKVVDEQVKQKTQQLREENVALQQQLQHSKNELTEKNSSTVKLQKRLDDLQEQKKEDDKNNHASQLSLKKPQITFNTGEGDSSQNMSMWSSFFWPLAGLLLLGLSLIIWWLLRTKRSSEDFNISDEFAATHLDDNQYIDDSYEEDPLEPSIKLDMAKAYIDSGDIHSAQGILKEVISMGSREQKRQAEALLAEL